MRSVRSRPQPLAPSAKMILLAIALVVLLTQGTAAAFAVSLQSVAAILLIFSFSVIPLLAIAGTRLVVRKKVALSALTVGIALLGVWLVVKAPAVWPSTRVWVVSIHPQRGTDLARLRYSAFLTDRTIDVPLTDVKGLRVGATIQLYSNPLNRTQVSLRPIQTVPGGSHPLLLSGAAMFIVAGLGLAFAGKRWVSGQTLAAPPLLSASAEDRLAQIDWFQFEGLCGAVLAGEGWAVEHRGGANPDGGADLVATRNGLRAVVQCKHWRHYMIRPKTVRELVGTMNSVGFRADSAILCTSAAITQAAAEYARENRVDIWDRARLLAKITEMGVDRFPALIRPEEKTCPKCGAPMVLRARVIRPFWGCKTYPRCTGKIEQVAL